MPLPWVFEWGALRRIDPEACARMSELFRGWIGQRLDMRWLWLALFLALCPWVTNTLRQLVWARHFLSVADSSRDLAYARALLDGTEDVPGLAVDTDLRWQIVMALASVGA